MRINVAIIALFLVGCGGSPFSAASDTSDSSPNSDDGGKPTAVNETGSEAGNEASPMPDSGMLETSIETSIPMPEASAEDVVVVEAAAPEAGDHACCVDCALAEVNCEAQTCADAGQNCGPCFQQLATCVAQCGGPCQ